MQLAVRGFPDRTISDMGVLDVVPWLAQGGAVALLFWATRLIFVGALVPRSTLERVEREKADIWAAYTAERERNHELTQQVGRFVTAVREVTIQ